MEMLALSIRQPWCWLILHGGKDIENRAWPTRFRGTFLIHASKGMTRYEYESAVDTARTARRDATGYVHIPPMKEIERGGIVGKADIVDCVERSNSSWFFGQYGFVLANVTPVPFQPWKGSLGFFKVPDSVSQAALAGPRMSAAADPSELLTDF